VISKQSSCYLGSVDKLSHTRKELFGADTIYPASVDDRCHHVFLFSHSILSLEFKMNKRLYKIHASKGR
jgi:hypothetical protein